MQTWFAYFFVSVQPLSSNFGPKLVLLPNLVTCLIFLPRFSGFKRSPRFEPSKSSNLLVLFRFRRVWRRRRHLVARGVRSALLEEEAGQNRVPAKVVERQTPPRANHRQEKVVAPEWWRRIRGTTLLSLSPRSLYSGTTNLAFGGTSCWVVHSLPGLGPVIEIRVDLSSSFLGSALGARVVTIPKPRPKENSLQEGYRRKFFHFGLMFKLRLGCINGQS